ncbi:MAG: EamA family transporter [Rubrobacteraceae bacterium]
MLGAVAVAGAAMIWSTSFTFTKVALVELPPLTIGALRFLAAALVLGILVGLRGELGRPGRTETGWLVLGGLLGTTIYFSMENIGVDLATATDAALLVASYPAIAMLLELLVYRTSVSWTRFAGVALAMAGVYLIVGQSPPVAGGGRLIGDVILVGAGVVWAFYSFVTRRVGRSRPMLQVVFYQTAAGALAFIPLAFVEVGEWRTPSVGTVLILGYLAVFCSGVAFLLYGSGLKGLDSGTAVNLLNLIPVFGVGFAFLLLREPVSTGQLLGGAVVICGVAMGLGLAERRKFGGARKENMGHEDNKCVMVLDEELPAGLAANTAGVLAVTLGRDARSVVGPEVLDGSGRRHAGITKVPISILKAGGEVVRDIRLRAEGEENLVVVDFTDAAQSSRTYEEYTCKMTGTPSDRLGYLGVALYGDKKAVNKLTGSLPLLK